MKKVITEHTEINNRHFYFEVVRHVKRTPSAPRLAMVCYMTNDLGRDLTGVCIESIRRFTPSLYELWVFDNGSRPKYIRWLQAQKDINLILNKTNPATDSPTSFLDKIDINRKRFDTQLTDGSVANGVGLEIVSRVIDPDSKYLFVMHNDVLAAKTGWLEFLLSKLDSKVRGAAVYCDPTRVGAMHVSGLLLDFQLFRPLQMSFMPNLPIYDVGDLITIKLRENEYSYYECRNTFIDSQLVSLIDEANPIRGLYSDRAFDDAGNVIYMHLGRGTPKSTGDYKTPGKTTASDWIRFANEILFQDSKYKKSLARK